MSTTPVNFDEMSLEQLREAALNSVGQTVTPPPAAEPAQAEPAAPIQAEPAAPAAPAATEEEEETDEPLYAREIDLGDGSGVQVFKAATLEELVDKLAEAQLNATRKIRELSASAKAAPAPKQAVTELTPDQEMQLGQVLLTEPSKAMRQLLEQNFGMPLEEIKEGLRVAQQTRVEKQAGDAFSAFLDQTPDFYVCDQNIQRIAKYGERMGLPQTTEGIIQAFNELNADGLLAKKPGPKPATEEGIPPTPAAPRKAASGMSARRTVTPPPTPQGPTDAELANMTTEQLRELAYRSVLQG